MMGYGSEDKNCVLELTYNYEVTEYDKGNAYAQVDFFSYVWWNLFQCYSQNTMVAYVLLFLDEFSGT